MMKCKQCGEESEHFEDGFCLDCIHDADDDYDEYGNCIAKQDVLSPEIEALLDSIYALVRGHMDSERFKKMRVQPIDFKNRQPPQWIDENTLTVEHENDICVAIVLRLNSFRRGWRGGDG